MQAHYMKKAGCEMWRSALGKTHAVYGSRDSDQALVRAASRDGAAFEELYRRYFLCVYRWAAMDGGDTHAEEVTQEAFIRAWRGIGRCKGDNFAGWLFRVVINTSKDEFRKRGRYARECLALTDAIDEVGQAEQVGSSEEGAFGSVEMRMLITPLLACLPEKQRVAICLRYFADLRVDDAAHALGVSPVACKALLHRALSTLRHKMQENQSGKDISEG